MLHTFLHVLLKMGIFNTLGFWYLYKGGGLDIRNTNIEAATTGSIGVSRSVSISVQGLNIRT